MSFSTDLGEIVPPGAEVVATRPGDRHLTLVFLGGVPEETVAQCWGDLPELALPAQVRPLAWERFGRRAIALVVSDDDGLLRAAGDACHDTAVRLVEVRRPDGFRPHVTMARVPRRARPPTAKVLSEWPVPSRPLDVGPATLFRSRSGGTGDRYEVVEVQPRAEA